MNVNMDTLFCIEKAKVTKGSGTHFKICQEPVQCDMLITIGANCDTQCMPIMQAAEEAWNVKKLSQSSRKPQKTACNYFTASAASWQRTRACGTDIKACGLRPATAAATAAGASRWAGEGDADSVLANQQLGCAGHADRCAASPAGRTGGLLLDASGILGESIAIACFKSHLEHDL